MLGGHTTRNRHANQRTTTRHTHPEPGSGQMPIGFRIIDIASDDKMRLRRWIAEPGGEYV